VRAGACDQRRMQDVGWQWHVICVQRLPCDLITVERKLSSEYCSDRMILEQPKLCNARA
jgi:hypothetical protein